MDFGVFGYDYAQRALLASSVVGITCGILGCFVILRRMALIGDALSHAILPGVVVGFMLFGHNPLAIFAGAVAAGLITSVIITWIQRNSITKDDASIGIVFTAMFAIGIIGISWLTKKDGVHLDMKDFLFGNVLGVSDADLWLTGLIGIYVLLCIILFFKYFFITTFDPLIALTMGISVAVVHYFLMFLLSLTIVASLQSVGVILVVAMLIIPSSTAYLLTSKLEWMLVISAIVGFISATSGFLVAVWLEITPGPTMTLMGSIIFAISLLFSPKRGFVMKEITKFRKRYIADQQDILKLIHKQLEMNTLTFDKLLMEAKYSPYILKWHLKHLQKNELLNFENNTITLTANGEHEADVLIRAHRVWESYLVNKMNVPTALIHESAETMEHILPAEFVDKIEHDLGYPESDPHGSPIPKLKKKMLKMTDIFVGGKATLADEQGNVVKELWQLGIFPNSEFVVKELAEENITIQTKDSIFVIKREIAERIKVKH
ncbi:MAG: metal ABC transporter permease [Cytophagales bacterium]